MGSFKFLALAVLKISTFKVRKRGDFLGRSSPYEIPESGDKISKFWVFKTGF